MVRSDEEGNASRRRRITSQVASQRRRELRSRQTPGAIRELEFEPSARRRDQTLMAGHVRVGRAQVNAQRSVRGADSSEVREPV